MAQQSPSRYVPHSNAQIAGSTPTVSDSIGLGLSPRICISRAAAGEEHLENHCPAEMCLYMHQSVHVYRMFIAAFVSAQNWKLYK